MSDHRQGPTRTLRVPKTALAAAAVILILTGCTPTDAPEAAASPAATVADFEEASDWKIPNCPAGDAIDIETLNEQSLPAQCRVDDTDLVFPDGGRIDVHGGQSGATSRTIDGVESMYGYFPVGPEGLVGYRQLLDSGEVVDWYGSTAGIKLVTDAFGSNLEREAGPAGLL